MPDVLLHVRQAQQQLQKLRSLIGVLPDRILRKQPDCQIALLGQPNECAGIERLALLAELQGPGDASEGVIQIVAQTDAVA
jgi:hypothetical protein